jgi:hypothetical protein
MSGGRPIAPIDDGKHEHTPTDSGRESTTGDALSRGPCDVTILSGIGPRSPKFRQ